MSARRLRPLIDHLRRAAGPPGDGTPTDAQLLERWARRRDQAAFELLVWRHGPLVLRTCRRLLGRYADAEDAFQATFLVLLRKAGSIRRREALGAWLHRVACRVALRARAAAWRRASREQPLVEAPAVPDPGDAAANDLRSVLDEEIDRLPPRYRRAVVLCCLEGKSQEEAARLLACPRGTVSSWLARARERLRVGLSRRGVTLGAGVALAGAAAPPGLPAALVVSTARAAALFAAGKAAVPGAISGEVAALAKGVLESMSMAKTKLTALALVLLAGVAAVAVARQEPPAVPSAAPPERSAPAAAPAREADEEPVAWGKAAGGLQAGLGFRPGDRRAAAAGESVSLVFYLRNVGSREVRLSHIETLFAEWMPDVEDGGGRRVRVAPGPASLGIVPIVRRSLGPGQ
jgi:RNA polymerase sigma factor (sigma-70 family)